MPPGFAYTVTATLPDALTTARYLDWLTAGGHVQAVLDAGAATADVIRLDPDTPDAASRVQTHYTFPSRAAYDRYVDTAAPALRADGVARFGDTVTFTRTLGDIVDTAGPA